MIKVKVAVINLGLGNIGSLINSITKLGLQPKIIYSGKELEDLDSTHILMPGVGAVNQAMNSIKKNNFRSTLEKILNNKNCYFCGICLGMQVLFESSDEFGLTKCLGWIPGKVRLLDSNNLSLPHMGWNTINVNAKNDKVFNCVKGKDMYFAHSFVVSCAKEYVAATSTYGSLFVSAIKKGNIYGIQSHPEKSSTVGSDFLKNFLLLGT